MRSSVQVRQEPESQPGPWAEPRRGAGPGRWGYSIVELIVVLMVVSAMAYVAVPRIEIFRFKMDGAARGAVAALVSSQRLAVKKQHDVVVAFDTAHRRLRIHQDRNNSGAVDDGEPIRYVPFDDGVVFGRGQAPWMGGATSTVTFTDRQDGMPALRYIRNGSASEEGTVYLSSTRAPRSAEFATDTRALRVERSTGRVTWFKYDPPGWIEEI